MSENTKNVTHVEDAPGLVPTADGLEIPEFLDRTGEITKEPTEGYVQIEEDVE